jgi:hypothetical protein
VWEVSVSFSKLLLLLAKLRSTKALTETLEQADEITDIGRVVKSWIGNADKNMETFSCEEAPDCLLAPLPEVDVKFAATPHAVILTNWRSLVSTVVPPWSLPLLSAPDDRFIHLQPKKQEW